MTVYVKKKKKKHQRIFGIKWFSIEQLHSFRWIFLFWRIIIVWGLFNSKAVACRFPLTNSVPFNGTQSANKPRRNSRESWLKGDDARFTLGYPWCTRRLRRKSGPRVHCVAASAIMRWPTSNPYSRSTRYSAPVKLNCWLRLSSDPFLARTFSLLAFSNGLGKDATRTNISRVKWWFSSVNCFLVVCRLPSRIVRS